MINLLRNSAVGYRRRGVQYGSELNTLSNATADPNGTEADATTGWVGNAGMSAGANVFESQGAVKNVGSYAIHTDINDTPTNAAAISDDLQNAPFSFTNGDEGKITFDIRHIGSGGEWVASFGATSSSIAGGVIITVSSTDTSFQSVEATWTHDSDHRYIVFRELSGTNDGGIYVDNVSIKKKL